MNVFGYDIHHTNAPDHFYNSLELRQSIDQLYQSSMVRSTERAPEQQGEGYTTFALPSETVYSLAGIYPLLDYIGFEIQSYHGAYHVTYDRAWTNKIYQGCYGSIHNHQRDDLDGVAIFYYQVPPNSSNLLIHSDNNYDPHHAINVQQGDLILHCDQVLHSVSPHNNSIPRICFILEYKLS